MTIQKVLVVLAHALVGWGLCDATMGIGMSLLPMNTILIVHAIAAPIFFAFISLVYFTKFHFTSPFTTAGIFVLFVMVVDFLVVALLINKNLEMFASLLGTWIPFTLIFLSTFLTGSISRGFNI